MTDLCIVPCPRKLLLTKKFLTLSQPGRIVIDANPELLLPVAKILQKILLETQSVHWHLWAGSYKKDKQAMAVIAVNSKFDMPQQAYKLKITPKRIHIFASDIPGAFYGVMTLKQILRQVKGTIPCLDIEDSPDYLVRGVMLDITRGKVPKVETLLHTIEMLAELKINHLQLHMEHVFAYRNHKNVWAQATPLTGEDILCIDKFCRERFIELVPNHNSFGHLERWLSLPQYNSLAERSVPDENQAVSMTLDPTNPQSLKLIDDIYSDLLPHFTSRKFNAGCDETFDLGSGKSKALCEKLGKGRVYLDFVLKINELVKQHGRTMMFWGDIIVNYPDLIKELPAEAVVLEWGYEASHRFDEHLARFRESGLEFYVCPGTSSWNSIAGRTQNCLDNIRNASASGLEYGAAGLITTDWGDGGHPQYLPISFLGFAAGAAMSWCYEANKEETFIDALDLHVFRDSSGVMGKIAYDLGNAHLKTGFTPENGSLFMELLKRADLPKLPESVSDKTLKDTRKYILSVIEPLRNAIMNREDASIVCREFLNCSRIMVHACERQLAIFAGDLDKKKVRNVFANDIRRILGEHRELWIYRNRVGGLNESTKMFEKLLQSYCDD